MGPVSGVRTQDRERGEGSRSLLTDGLEAVSDPWSLSGSEETFDNSTW